MVHSASNHVWGGKGKRWQTNPARLNLPSGTKNWESRTSQSHSSGRWELLACVRSVVLLAATSCHPLHCASVGGAVLGPCSNRKEKKMDSRARMYDGPTPIWLQLCTANRCCKFHSETVFDREMQLFGFLLLRVELKGNRELCLSNSDFLKWPWKPSSLTILFLAVLPGLKEIVTFFEHR